MEYEKIVAVTGLPGLYELVSSKNDGAIVRGLEDKSTRFVSSRVHNFSHLESIEVYTSRENVNLVDVFNAMEKSGEKLPGDKDNSAVKKYFEKVYPEMDFDRVYASDMKKMVKWYGVLKANNVEIKLRELPEEEELAPVVEEEEAVVEKPAKEKKAAEPAKKAAKAAAPAREEKEEKPAKAKAAKAEVKEEAPKKKAAAAKPAKEKEEKKKEAPAKKKDAAPKKSAKK